LHDTSVRMRGATISFTLGPFSEIGITTHCRVGFRYANGGSDGFESHFARN